MIPIVVVAVVLVIPMTLMVLPTAVVVIVMRVGPIRARIRRPAPYSRDPYIPCPGPVPISIDPGITRTRNSWPDLIAQRRRFVTDIDTDLGKGWSGDC
jgi:hypothetical protein